MGVVVQWLENRRIPYMVFGGIANSIYGNPRQTFDVDIKVSLESGEEIEGFIEALRTVGTVLPENPMTFVRKTNVLPVEVEDVRIDLVVAELPFEKEGIERSAYVDFSGVRMKVCQPEDLIIQKVVSTREKDWMDIESIVDHQRDRMDWDYLLKHCRELAAFMDDPTIYTRIEKRKDEE